MPRGCCRTQIRAEKEALAKKLKAMESKILKGDQAGGLAEVTKKKEEELKRKEQELERRCAASLPVHRIHARLLHPYLLRLCCLSCI